MANTKGQIFGINGPVVKVKGSDSFEMQEMVYVGNEELIGEVIGVTSDTTIVQVYEETTGLKKGEPVVGTGGPLSITLAPGILSDIFDGIERPLKEIRNMSGSFIGRGLKVTNLDERKTWNVEMVAKQGDYVTGGDIIAVTQETSLIEHRIMIPPNIKGKIEWIAPNGNYTIVDIIAKVKSDDEIIDITMKQKWPIKKARPYTQRQPISRPLVTGQRVIDTMFPLAKGGAAAVPGGFGTGKTMTQHQLAKWCDADIIVYIGCGERGNEMTQVLDEFSELIDPKSNRPLLDRTMLIANTSNMPVAAREASIYTGVTIADITEIWVMTLRLWLTQHHVGLRHFVKYRVVLKKCLRKKVSLHILLQDFRLSMKERDMLQILTAVRVLYQLSVRYHHRAVTSQNR